MVVVLSSVVVEVELSSGVGVLTRPAVVRCVVVVGFVVLVVVVEVLCVVVVIILVVAFRQRCSLKKVSEQLVTVVT